MIGAIQLCQTIKQVSLNPAIMNEQAGEVLEWVLVTAGGTGQKRGLCVVLLPNLQLSLLHTVLNLSQQAQSDGPALPASHLLA